MSGTGGWTGARVTTVHRLRVGRADSTAAGVATWARTALPRADLCPRGLAPSAVLVIRRLSAAVPPAGRLETGSPGAGAWEARLRGSVSTAHRTAIRPVRGTVADDAAAVVFADPAELVACLVAAALRGGAAVPWWGAGIVPSGARADVSSLLSHRVELLPGVLDVLEGWRLAVPAVRRVSTADCRRLLADVRGTFDLPTPPARGPAALGRGPSTADQTVPQTGADQAAPRPAWEPWLGRSTVPPGLAAEQAALLAAGLLLSRSPGAVRTPAVAAALGCQVPPRSAPSDQPSPAGVATVPPRVEPAPAAGGPASPPGAPSRPAGGRSRSDRGAGHPEGAGPQVGATTRPGPPAAPSRQGSADRAAGAVGPGVAAGDVPPGGGDARRFAAVVTGGGKGTPAEAPFAAGVAALHTGLGGVFYLVNLLDQLVSVAPEAGWRVGELSGWALLEGLSRGLLGQDHEVEDRDDPVWRLLAALDGRSPTGPNGGSPPAVLDVPPGLVAAAAQRLEADLGLEPEGVPGVLRVPAVVHHTRTHVDVVFDLESISLPVRLAGLDRDPGWVPHLGRVLAFAFVAGNLP